MASPNLRVALLSHGEECESKEDDLNSEPFVNLTKQSQRALIGVTESLCEHNMTCLMVFFADQSAIAAETARIVTRGIGREGEEMPLKGLLGNTGSDGVVSYLEGLKTKGLAMILLIGDAGALAGVACGLGIEATMDSFKPCTGLLLERSDQGWTKFGPVGQ
eukprot:TRINITY_DN804_c0_g1_i8.p1 TRINITY_DN804_c0_g1~~TRINITY_DN804_c0_g1_i8.p1  ORF type:complete len:162 (-),score=38.56 TRINITY_DN804_c0_g1_i8:376-861(-)